MTVLLFVRVKLKKPPPAESCCPTLPKKSRSAAQCSLLARDVCWTAVNDRPIGVEVGDEVLFGKYGGTDIEVDGEEVKILRESDILAKVV